MTAISIIIPTYNEQANIAACLQAIRSAAGADVVEIIIADSPNSTDNLEEIAESYDVTYFKTQKAGRNFQQNEGAKLALSDILYFVHADTLVHPEFVNDVTSYIASGADMGCYRYVFDKYRNPLMYINTFFTRMPMLWCRGGDQTLFIKKEVFKALNGFCEKHIIMEEYDLLRRGIPKYTFKIIPKNVVVSARKYAKNGYFRVQVANLKVMQRWLKHESEPEELYQLYKSLLNN